MAYPTKLYTVFNRIFADNYDTTPDSRLAQDINNREEILFMQFPLEKYGKNFGISEMRIFKIQNRQLYQVDKNGEEKILPIPVQVKQEKKQNFAKEWAEKCPNHPLRLNLQFQDRKSIYIYFQIASECNEINAAICAIIHQHKEKKPFAFYPKLYYDAVAANFSNLLIRAKDRATRLTKTQLKTSIFECILKNLNDKVYVSDFCEKWFTKAKWSSCPISTTIMFSSLEATENLSQGEIKLWIKDSVHSKISFQETSFEKVFIEGVVKRKFLAMKQIILTNVNSLLELQFQLQSGTNIWKSERFCSRDLKSLCIKESNVALTLHGRASRIILKISVAYNKILAQRTPPQINPKCYPLIGELYCPQKMQYDLERIHFFHKGMYEFGWSKELYPSGSFWEIKTLSDLLKVDEPLDKFYKSQLFMNASNTTCRATFVYQYWVKAQRTQYYDVERLIWKYGAQHSRILNALKAFDQTPRFNFTEPFYLLVDRLSEFASSESILRWNDTLYQKSLMGQESMVFFLVIAIVKALPGIFVCQQPTIKRSLPANSLLFHYILQAYLPKIMTKLAEAELNIEALFGQQFTSLLARLFDSNTLGLLWKMLFEEKKGSPSTLFCHTLIGAFLSLLEQGDSYDSAYISSEHYIFMIQEISRLMPNRIHFFKLVEKWAQVSRKTAEDEHFQQLLTVMQGFYEEHAYQNKIGEIIQQVYQEFTCYHYKNQTDNRNLFLVFDRIDLLQGTEGHPLKISVYQDKMVIYEHTFNNVETDHLHHSKVIKMQKLSQLQIVCTRDNNMYYCRLDPKDFPSNYYFYFNIPLSSLQLEPSNMSHIFLQAYISDSCLTDQLENPFPQAYLSNFFLNRISQASTAFCNQFLKTFRMKENNFNLLYSKLGWYGNHYIIPDQRLLYMFPLTRASPTFANYAFLSKYTRCVFGRALLPYNGQITNLQLIKGGVACNYEPKGGEREFHDSASRLLCYPLQNFNMDAPMSFSEFYYKVTSQLPLFRYLTYIPSSELECPCFSLQISNECSTCLVTITPRGQLFRTDFTPEEIKSIQDRSRGCLRLIDRIQFRYASSSLLFDTFLIYLRLNLLSAIPTLEERTGKKWPNGLVVKNNNISNHELSYFYQLMNEAKEIVQLEFRDVQVVSKLQKYVHFGLILGRWKKVSWIVQIETGERRLVFVMEQHTRKKYLLKWTDFIQTTTERVRIINLAENRLAQARELIDQEIAQD